MRPSEPDGPGARRGAGADQPLTDLRVLVLTKRRYMSKDVISDRYGRFRELPMGLAALGAEVRAVALSYRGSGRRAVVDRADDASVPWSSFNLSDLVPGRRGYWAGIDDIAARFRPSVVWACSDIPHAWLGIRVARRLGVGCVIDLYDNFEAYPLARIPGIVPALRSSIRAATGVTCVSEPLEEYVREAYGFRGRTRVITNAVPSGEFFDMDRMRCRSELGLPSHARIVGTAGALGLERGTQHLLEAFLQMAQGDPTLHLALAGPLLPGLDIPAHPRIHYLGMLASDRVPTVIGALDVSVICNVDDAFGRYCFPQKLYECLASRRPVVAASVGATARVLSAFPRALFAPASAESLKEALSNQLNDPFIAPLPVPTWSSMAARLGEFLLECSLPRSRGGT